MSVLPDQRRPTQPFPPVAGPQDLPGADSATLGAESRVFRPPDGRLRLEPASRARDYTRKAPVSLHLVDESALSSPFYPTSTRRCSTSCFHSRTLPPTAAGRIELPESGPERSRSHAPATLFPPAQRSAAVFTAAPYQSDGHPHPVMPLTPTFDPGPGAGQHKVQPLTVTPHQGQLPAGVVGPAHTGLYVSSPDSLTGPISTLPIRDLRALRQELKARRSDLRTELDAVTSLLRARRETSRRDRGRSSQIEGETSLSRSTPVRTLSDIQQLSLALEHRVVPQTWPGPEISHAPTPHLYSVCDGRVKESSSTTRPSLATHLPAARPSYSAWPAYDTDSDTSSESEEAATAQDDHSNPPTSSEPSDEYSTHPESYSSEPDSCSQYSSYSASLHSPCSQSELGTHDEQSDVAEEGFGGQPLTASEGHSGLEDSHVQDPWHGSDDCNVPETAYDYAYDTEAYASCSESSDSQSESAADSNSAVEPRSESEDGSAYAEDYPSDDSGYGQGYGSSDESD